MIHYYNYRPDGQSTDQDSTRSNEPHKRHPLRKLLKWLSIVFLVGAVLIFLMALAAYFYTSRTPLDNTAGRTNILILGVDEAAKLSDTIMVVSIRADESGAFEKAVFTSIPRDLYVQIPGFGGSKINAAHAYGENNNYPGGGPALTTETLELELGIPIHYYVALDFDGFEAIIDSVGGVTVEAKTSINDPFYPASGHSGYEPFELEAGVHILDGETALKYARSRQTTNDFDRAFRQQQIVLALREELSTTGKDFRNYRQIISLLEVAESSVNTDMSRLELVKLAVLLRELDSDDVSQYVIDTTNLLVGSTNHAGNVLVPRAGDFREIRQFFDHIFTQDSIDTFSQTQF